MQGEGDDLPGEVEARILEYEKKSRYLRKRSEDYEVVEDVFDKGTRMALYHLINRGALHILNGAVKTGKESRVYWGVRADGTDLAVKIYLTVAVEFRRRIRYIDGDPRFVESSKSIKDIINLWAKKEYRNLTEAFQAGVRVPEPYNVYRNVLIMRFIGEGGVPAPTLREAPVTQKDYRMALEQVRMLYQKAGLVHADLSEYNIFKWRGELILFDFGSAVSVEHPSSDVFLEMDIENLNRFFKKKGVRVQPTIKVVQKVKDG